MTIAAIHQLGASVVFTDVCTQRALEQPAELDAFHAALKKASGYLVVLAAGFHIDPSADLVVNPYLLGDWTAPLEDDGRVLTGPKYFLFRREFIEAAARPRQVADPVRRVAIVVGGSDPAGLTPVIMRALASVTTDVEATTVIGAGAADAIKQEARATAAMAGPAWTVREHCADMADFFLCADAAITGDGLTKYETAVTGTPSLIVARPDSDPRINVVFCAGGTALGAGPDADGAYSTLAPQIARLLGDAALRRAMSSRGRELLDGRGLERVLARIPLHIQT